MWTPPTSIPTADELVAELDKTVAGLAEQKRRLAITLVRHALCAARGLDYPPINSLVLGPTGGGKTWMVRQACEVIGLPFVEGNCTQYTEAGFFGQDLPEVLLGFTEEPYVHHGERQTDMIPLAERYGVVILDEIDKWRYDENSKDRQTGKAMQAELLRVMEGQTLYPSRVKDKRGYAFSTHQVMFIGTGAFQGINEQMHRWYQRDPAREYMLAEPVDIQRFGFLMEMIGRFASIIPLPPLEATHMASILRQFVLPRYMGEAKEMEVELVVPQEALMEIAGLAIMKQTGARGFSSIMEKLLWKALSKAQPGETVLLGVEQVLGQEAIVLKKEAA